MIWYINFPHRRPHGLNGLFNGIISPSLPSGRNCPKHGASHTAPVCYDRNPDFPAEDIRHDLHNERVLLGNTASGIKLPASHPRHLHLLYYHPLSKSYSFHQRPVNFLGPCLQGHTKQTSPKVAVHQNRAASIPPVKGNHTAASRFQSAGLFIHPLEYRHIPAGCLLAAGSGKTVFHEPLKMVPHAGLPRLVGVISRNGAVRANTAKTFHRNLIPAYEDITSRGTNHHEHGALTAQS